MYRHFQKTVLVVNIQKTKQLFQLMIDVSIHIAKCGAYRICLIIKNIFLFLLQ